MKIGMVQVDAISVPDTPAKFRKSLYNPDNMLRKGRIPVTDVNPHLLCVLCGGYFVDATTIIECLHSYCRTCIVRYLETSKMCPLCDVLVHKTKPLENLRADKTLQDLVYKLVPGLFESEMANRRKFYAEHPEECEDATLEDRGEACMEKSEEDEEEKISLVLELSITGHPPESPKAKISDKRYLLCPSGATIGHLKKFVTVKFSVPSKFQIQFYHSRVELSNNLSLHDIANLYTWRRTEPLRLFYMICQSPPKTADVITTPEGRRRRISECKARQERKLANLLDFTASESPIKIGSARSPKYFDDSDTDNAITDKCTFIRDVNENCVKRNNSDSDSSVDERPRMRWKDSPRSKKSGIFIKPRTPMNGKHKLLRFSDHFVKPKLSKLDIYSKSSRKSKHSDSQLLNDTKIVDSMKLLKIDKTCTNVLNSVKNERKGDIFDFSDDTSVRSKVVSLPKRPKERKNYTLIRPGNNIKTNDVKPELCPDPHDINVDFNMHMPYNKLNDVILKSVLSKTKCDPEKTLIVKQEKSSHLDKLTKNCDSLTTRNSNVPDSNKSYVALKNNSMDHQCKGISVNLLAASANTNSAKKFKIWKPHLTDEELEIEKKFTTSSTVIDKPKTISSNIQTSPRKILNSTQISTKTKPPNSIISEKTAVNTHLSNDTPIVKINRTPVANSTATILQHNKMFSVNPSTSSFSIPNSKIKSNASKQSSTSTKQTTSSNRGRRKAAPKSEKTNSKEGPRAKQKSASPIQKSASPIQKSAFPKQKSKQSTITPHLSKQIGTDKSKSQPQNSKQSRQTNEIVNKSNKVLPLLQITATASSQPALTNNITSSRNISDIPLEHKTPFTLASPSEKPEYQKRLDDEDAVMGLLELSKGTKLPESTTPSGKQPEMSWLNPKRSTLIQNKASSSSETKPVEKKLDFKNWEYLKQKCSKIKTKSLSTSSSKDVPDNNKKPESSEKTSSEKSGASTKSTNTINSGASEIGPGKRNEEKSDFGLIIANDQSCVKASLSNQIDGEAPGDNWKTANKRNENTLVDESANLKGEDQSREKINKIQTGSQNIVDATDVKSEVNSTGTDSGVTFAEINKDDIIVSDKCDVSLKKANMTDVNKSRSDVTKTATVEKVSKSNKSAAAVSCDSNKSKVAEHKKRDVGVVDQTKTIKLGLKNAEAGHEMDNKKIKEKTVDKIHCKTTKGDNKIDNSKNMTLKSQASEKKIQPVVENDKKSTENNNSGVTDHDVDKVVNNENINNCIRNDNSSGKEVENKNIDMKITDNKKTVTNDERKTDSAKMCKQTESVAITCPLDRELQICVSTEQNMYNNTTPVPSIVTDSAKRNGDVDNFSVRTKKQKAIDVIVKQINERNDSKMKSSGSGSVSSLSPNSGSMSSLSPTSPTSPLSPVFRNEKRGEIVMRTKKDEVRKIMNSYKNSENSVESPVVLNTTNRVPTQNQTDKKRPAEKCEMNIPKKRKLDSSIISEIVHSEAKGEQIKHNISCENNSLNVQDNHKIQNSVTDTSNQQNTSKVNLNSQDKVGKSALSEEGSFKLAEKSMDSPLK